MQDRPAAVGDDAAVELVQRVGDHAGPDDVLDGQVVPVAGQRVELGVLPDADGDLGQLLGGRAELVHVALGDHGVGADQGVAERRLELGRPRHRPAAALPELAGAERPAHAGELVGAVGDQDRVGPTVPDGGGGVLDVELEAGAAGHRPVDPAVVDAEVLRHGHGVVHHDPAAARRHVAVDVGLGHAAVLQDPLHGQDVVLDPVQLGRDRVVRQRDPGDHRRPIRPQSHRRRP